MSAKIPTIITNELPWHKQTQCITEYLKFLGIPKTHEEKFAMIEVVLESVSLPEDKLTIITHIIRSANTQ